MVFLKIRHSSLLTPHFIIYKIVHFSHCYLVTAAINQGQPGQHRHDFVFHFQKVQQFLLFLFCLCNSVASIGHSLGHYLLLISVVSHAAISNYTFRTRRLSMYLDTAMAHPLLLMGLFDFSQTAKQFCYRKGIFLTFTLLQLGQTQPPQAGPSRTQLIRTNFSFMGGPIMCLQGFFQQ